MKFPVVRLNPNGRTRFPDHFKSKMSPSNGAPLRTLRIRSGLSQREVAEILGFRSDVPALRHERSQTFPNLRTALAYEILFQVPVSLQFPALYRAIEPVIEERISELRRRLEDQSTERGNAARNTRKLEFFWERDNPTVD
jgi:transcriptional regulator with XRE-family HTH domain